MAAAWSFSRKDGVEAASRVVSARSLDGRLVRCKIAIRFQRPLAKDVAESAADEASMLLAEIIGEEIIQDALPFDGMELVNRLRARVGGKDGRVAAYNVSELDLVPEPGRGARTASSNGAARRTGSQPPPPPVRPSGFVPVERGSAASVAPTLKSSEPGRPRTLWQTALAACPAGVDADRVGRLLSAPFRDSVAQLVLRVTIALEPATIDRLALLRDRNMDRQMSLVVLAAGACLGAAFYRVLVSGSVPQRDALQIVEVARREALGTESADADTLGRYIASEAPLRDLSRRAAAALGSSEDATRIFEALSAYAEVLRTDFAETVRQIHRIRV